MTLDPLTFALEILNFLVLLWLLQRFLFRPIRGALVQRQQHLQQAQQDARQQEQQAKALQQELQQQLQDWEQSKQQQQQALQQQLSQERERALNQVRAEADAEKQRLQVVLEQDRAALAQRTLQQARQGALQLTGHLLQRVAGPELDQALLNMLMEDCAELPASDRQELIAALHSQQGPLPVESARPLSSRQQQQLQQSLCELLKQELQIENRIQPDLISGLRVHIGPRILHANLADELGFFKAELPDAL